MYIGLVLILAVAVLAVQIQVCRKTQRMLARLLPAFALAAAQVICWIVFLFLPETSGAVLTTVICSVVLVLLLGADLLGWAVYGIIHLLTARKKREADELEEDERTK